MTSPTSHSSQQTRESSPSTLVRARIACWPHWPISDSRIHAPVSHLILTHAHFDHIGGAAAVRGPDTQVIAAAGFPSELEQQRHWSVPRSWTGSAANPASDVQPDRLISERTSLVVGETEFVLIPVRGGEQAGALMVHLPASGLLFTGDVMMPYLGVPFTPEGSPGGTAGNTAARPTSWHPGSS